MGTFKYIITVESEKPPEVYLGAIIGGAKVVSLQAEELPKTVGTAWLLERYEISKTRMINILRPFNKGGDSKHIYDPTEVMPILEDLKATTANRRGAKRKN